MTVHPCLKSGHLESLLLWLKLCQVERLGKAMLLRLFIQATDICWAFTYAGSSARSQGHSDNRDLVFVIKNLQSDGEEAWEMVCPVKWWEYAEGAMGIQKDCVWTKGQTRCWWAYHLQVKYYNGKYRYCLVSWQSKMKQLRHYYLEKSIWMLFFFFFLASWFHFFPQPSCLMVSVFCFQKKLPQQKKKTKTRNKPKKTLKTV